MLAVGVVGLCVLVAGCTAEEQGGGARPPILDLFEQKQEIYDELPRGSPALLSVFADSSRSLGSTGIYRFFVARGLLSRYCVIAVDVYDVQVGQVCGGDSFAGELTEGVKFAFGAFFAGQVPRAQSLMQFSAQFLISIDETPSAIYPAVEQIFARDQVPSDVPPGVSLDPPSSDIGSYRLFADDRGAIYHISRTSWAGPLLCVSVYEQDSFGNGRGSGSCGIKDVVLYTADGLSAHFSAAGFEGETPAGWREVMPLLRVKEAQPEPHRVFP